MEEYTRVTVINFVALKIIRIISVYTTYSPVVKTIMKWLSINQFTTKWKTALNTTLTASVSPELHQYCWWHCSRIFHHGYLTVGNTYITFNHNTALYSVTKTSHDLSISTDLFPNSIRCRYSVVQYHMICAQHNSDLSRTYTGVSNHEIHPISHPHGLTMGGLLWWCWRKLTASQRHRTVIYSYSLRLVRLRNRVKPNTQTYALKLGYV